IDLYALYHTNQINPKPSILNLGYLPPPATPKLLGFFISPKPPPATTDRFITNPPCTISTPFSHLYSQHYISLSFPHSNFHFPIISHLKNAISYAPPQILPPCAATLPRI